MAHIGALEEAVHQYRIARDHYDGCSMRMRIAREAADDAEKAHSYAAAGLNKARTALREIAPDVVF